MSQVETEQPVTPTIGANALKIVVFGMPDAGKTSLLGALAQAAETQEHALGGELNDVTGELKDLRSQVYESKPKRTGDEVIAYPVEFDPDEAFGKELKTSRVLKVVFFDCDGRAANEYVSHTKSLEKHYDTFLARALLQADTLLLVVDASSRAEILNRDFNQFVRFLHLFQENRSQRNEVNGLPVYLVLSKCDLLAKDSDTPSVWMDRIEERKRKVDEQLRNHLAKEKAQSPFGLIDLHVWATAIKRPALGNSPARTTEPYQVAELFRQGIQSATDFHRHRRHAQRKLNMTVGAVLGVAAMMILLALTFYIFRERPDTSLLSTKVRNFQTQYDKDSTDRFSNLGNIIPQLKSFKENAEFSQIEPDLQNFVNRELAELTAYQDFAGDVSKKSKDPTTIQNLDELQELRTTLESIQPEEKYRTDWVNTPVMQQRRKQLAEIKAISSTVKELNSQFEQIDKLRIEANEHRKKLELNEAEKKVQQALKIGKTLPKYKDDAEFPIPGDQTHITWGNIFQYESVEEYYQNWQTWEKELKILYNAIQTLKM